MEYKIEKREDGQGWEVIAINGGLYKGSCICDTKELAEIAMGEAQAIDAGELDEEDAIYQWDY